MNQPVVLSYFSQSRKPDEEYYPNENDYLKFLEGEYKSIAKAWEQYKIQTGSDRYIAVDFPARGSADGDEVAEDIRNYKNRIILFHFSGHAKSKHLLFKDGASHAQGIAGLLGEAPNLKLVVLNGCATYDQVKLLFDNKVKIVIATRGKVNDGIASKFSDTFYRALSTRDYTIWGAYKHALNELHRDPSNLDSNSTEPVIWRGLDTGSEAERDRWELYVKEEWIKLIDNPDWWQIEGLPSPYKSPATLLSPKGVDNPNVFVGRNEELQLIRQKFDDRGRLMLINAEGGIGKTTLAARFWNDSLYEYKHNAWLFCENGIMNALKELAPKLNVDLTGLDEARQLVALRYALSLIHDDFLLVLDNANDAGDIQTFKQEFEGFHWHVLITSRCQGVLEKEQELSITHLPPPLAKELFKKYYKQDSPDFDVLLDRLLEAFRYHTLLVELFAKNLNEASELGTTLGDFLQKLETEGLYLGEDSFEIQTSYTSYVRKTAATTDDILDILYNFSTLSEDQRYLLVNLALLPAENYTLLFLIDLLAPGDKKSFRATLKSLYQKGWLSGTEKTYRLSPVVQGLVLKKNKETRWEDAKNLIERFANHLELEDDKDNIITKFRWVPLTLPLLKLVEESTEPLFATFLNNLAMVLKALGGEQNLTRASGLLQKALASDIANFGPTAPTVVRSQSNLATVLLDLGGEHNLTRARGLLQEALDSDILNFGPTAPPVASSQSNLATVLQALGGEHNLTRASGLLQEALDSDIANFGPTAPPVVRSQSNLATVLLDLGGEQNLTRASGLLQEALDSNIANFGPTAPTVAVLQSNLAMVLRALGGEHNLTRASGLLQEALDSNMASFGPTAPAVARNQSNLATVLQALGGEQNLTRASALLQEALDSDTANFGPTAPAVARSQSNLATVLQDLGGEHNLTRARALLQEALDSDMASFGPTAPPVAVSQSNLALVLQALGGEQNLTRARGLLQEALDSNIANFGPTAPTVASSQSNLATVLLDLGGEQNLTRASGLLQKALDSDIANFGDKAPAVAVLQANLATILKDLGGEQNLTRASALLQKALDSNIANFGDKAPTVAVLQSNLALVLRYLGGEQNLTRASGLLQEALASDIANFGESSPKLVTTGWNLFTTFLQMNSIQEAVNVLLLIYPISDKHLPKNHPLKSRIRKFYNQFKDAGY